MSPSKKTEKSGLEKTIDGLLFEMTAPDGNSEEYTKMVTNLDTLYKLKAIDKPERVKPDTLAIIAGNVLVVLVIVSFEQKHILTTKALSFITQLRPTV